MIKLKSSLLILFLLLSMSVYAQERFISNIMFKNVEYQRVFLVDKSRKKSYLVEIKNDTLKLIREFNDIIVGAGNGDKLREGDLKTPTGIYYVINFIPQSKLEKIYGTGAFPLNYPNFVDKLNSKTGHGIWIHGRDPNEKKQTSRGCVVLHNEDINYLKGIDFLTTPVIITESLTYTDEMNYNSERSYWLNFLDEFYQSWKENDINRLSKLIHVRFKDSNHKSYAEYIKRKKSLMEIYPQKKIIFDNIKIFKENDSEVVFDFDQYYSAPNITTFGTKRLYLIKEAGDFKIIAEEYITKPNIPQKYKTPDVVTVKNETTTEQKIESKPAPKDNSEKDKIDKVTKNEKQETKKSEKVKELSLDDTVKKFVYDWADAWQSKDIDRYIKFYSEDFKSSGMNYSEWKDDKGSKFSRIKTIKVDISDIKTRKVGEKIEVSFRQIYKTESMNNKGIKKLTLIKTNDGLKIISEVWSPAK